MLGRKDGLNEPSRSFSTWTSWKENKRGDWKKLFSNKGSKMDVQYVHTIYSILCMLMLRPLLFGKRANQQSLFDGNDILLSVFLYVNVATCFKKLTLPVCPLSVVTEIEYERNLLSAVCLYNMLYRVQSVEKLETERGVYWEMNCFALYM